MLNKLVRNAMLPAAALFCGAAAHAASSFAHNSTVAHPAAPLARAAIRFTDLRGGEGGGTKPQ